MVKDSFIANETNQIKPTGVKNLSSFLSTLNSKKFSTLNIWTDGSWTAVTQPHNIIKFQKSPIISLNIGYCKDLDKDNLVTLGEDINNQLIQIQKNFESLPSDLTF